MNKLKQLLQNICIAAAGGLVFIPIMWTSFTGEPFSELTSRILISGSMLCASFVLLLDLDPSKKKGFYFRLGCCIALLILLILQWI